MILKDIEIPIKLLKLEALIRRLNKVHPKMPLIKEKYATEQAGYRGEQSLNYYFQFLEQQDHLILRSVRLLNSYDYYFQIDTLILTPYFITIADIKNYAGTLFFDQDFHQLIRTIEDKVETFQCPILQIDRHEKQLKSLLAINKFPKIPIHSFVVISNPASTIKTDTKHIQKLKEKVIHAGFFPHIMERQFNTHRTEAIPLKDLKKLARFIIKQNTPLNPDILQQFQIEKSDILTGVRCPNCQLLGMIRMNGTWHCMNCKTDNRNAHIEALQDYALLLGQTITNKQLRNFLHIPSTSVANKLLASLNLQYSGDKRGRIYQLPNIYD